MASYKSRSSLQQEATTSLNTELYHIVLYITHQIKSFIAESSCKFHWTYLIPKRHTYHLNTLRFAWGSVTNIIYHGIWKRVVEVLSIRISLVRTLLVLLLHFDELL